MNIKYAIQQLMPRGKQEWLAATFILFVLTTAFIGVIATLFTLIGIPLWILNNAF